MKRPARTVNNKKYRNRQQYFRQIDFHHFVAVHSTDGGKWERQANSDGFDTCDSTSDKKFSQCYQRYIHFPIVSCLSCSKKSLRQKKTTLRMVFMSHSFSLLVMVVSRYPLMDICTANPLIMNQ